MKWNGCWAKCRVKISIWKKRNIYTKINYQKIKSIFHTECLSCFVMFLTRNLWSAKANARGCKIHIISYYAVIHLSLIGIVYLKNVENQTLKFHFFGGFGYKIYTTLEKETGVTIIEYKGLLFISIQNKNNYEKYMYLIHIFY